MTSQGLSEIEIEIELGGGLGCSRVLLGSCYSFLTIEYVTTRISSRLYITCYHTEFPTANTARSNKGTRETDGR